MSKKVLITGMSGTGKSTIINYLKNNNINVIDLDDDSWIYRDSTGERYININLIKEELNKYSSIVISGCFINQKELYPCLDEIILLEAPLDIMKERISKREDNSFGKSEEEWNKIVDDTNYVFPLIKKNCTGIIDTNRPIKEVINEVLSYL